MNCLTEVAHFRIDLQPVQESCCRMPHSGGLPFVIGSFHFQDNDEMADKREQPEDIVLMLLQVEVLQGQGESIQEAVRQIGVTVQTYYRWRKKYDGKNHI